MNTAPNPTPPAPSTGTLLKATLVAIVAAAIVLVVAVLPAEYGIDPLGAGRATGLTALFEAGAEAEEDTAPTRVAPSLDGGPHFPQLYQFRTDVREFTIAPGTGMEFKYDLDKGQTMLYAWKASNFVEYDFHTEPEGLPSEASDSFDQGSAAQKRGAYTAPYNGIHGWWWENTGNRDVTVTLETAGFYDEAMLFMPKTPPQTVEIPERADAKTN